MFFTNSYVFLVIVFSFCVCVEFFCCIRCIHYQTLCVCVCARVCVRVWIYLVFTNFYLSMFTDDGFLMTVLVVTCVVCFVWLFCPGVVMLLCLCVCWCDVYFCVCIFDVISVFFFLFLLHGFVVVLFFRGINFVDVE